MKQIITLTFLALHTFKIISALSGQDKFLVNYAMTKARESCVGEKLTRIWEKQVRHVVEECRYPHGVPSHDPGYYPPGHPVPIGPEYIGRHIPLGFLPDHAIAIGNPGIGFGIAIPTISGVRHKRSAPTHLKSATDGKNLIQSLVHGEKRILEQIANVTCVLRNLRVIGPDGELLIGDMVQATSQMPVDPYLKEDLLDGLDRCSNFVACLPTPRRLSALIPFELKKAYAFVRCSQLKRQEACVKKDIRRNINKNFPKEVRVSLNLDGFAQRMLDVLLAEDVQEYESLLL